MVRFTLRLPQRVYDDLVMRALASRRSVNRQVVHDLDMASVDRSTRLVVVDLSDGDADQVEEVIRRVTEAGW